MKIQMGKIMMELLLNIQWLLITIHATEEEEYDNNNNNNVNTQTFTLYEKVAI